MIVGGLFVRRARWPTFSAGVDGVNADDPADGLGDVGAVASDQDHPGAVPDWRTARIIRGGSGRKGRHRSVRDVADGRMLCAFV
jgi:hypothetical protein